jgi:hypothetical protein
MRIGTSPPKTSRGWVLIGRVKAALLVITCLGTMAACLVVPMLLRSTVTEQEIVLSGFGALFLERPWVGVLLGVPALAASVPLLVGARRTILWMTIATLLLLLPFAFLLMGFVSCLAPLYEYRAL